MQKVWATIGMILTIILIIILMIACQGGIMGNGKVETKERDIGNFSRLVISGNFNVFLDPAGKPALKMEMDENLFDIVSVTEEGETLRIETRINILQARKKSLYITFRDLDKLDLSGAVTIVSDSVLKVSSLGIKAAGAARLEFEIEGENLKMDMSGASECDLRGKVNDLRIRLTGAGDFDMADLIARNVEIDLSGAGHGRVFAKEKLDVSISGVGSVRYRGDPEIHKNISGLGSLKRD